MPRVSESNKQQTQSQEIPTVGYVRLPQILRVYPISAAGWWNGVRDGRFPKSYKLGPRTTAWKAADIRKLIGESA